MAQFNIETLHETKTSENLKSFYDQTADDYDRGMVDELGWIAPDLIATRVQQLAPQNCKIIDVGAGTGLVGQRLAAVGYTYVDGFDISERMLRAAEAKRVYRELRLAKLGEPLPYPNSFYDIATACGVFTHLHAPAASFDEVARVIKSGGFIVLTLRGNADPGRETTQVVNAYDDKLKQLVQNGQLQEVEKSSPMQLRPLSKHQALHRICVYRVL
jgi:predicted TPR repeat methyltransferase